MVGDREFVLRGCRDRDERAGRLYTPDPAAVARLNEMMAAERENRRQREERKRAAAARVARELAARRSKGRKGDDNMPKGKPIMNEDLARALHARAVAGESTQALAKEAGYAHQGSLISYWRKMGLPGVREARAAADGETAVDEVMDEPWPDDEPAPDWGPEVPAVAPAAEPYAVLDTFDRRLASLRSLADELSEKGVRVRVSGRIVVELEF